MGMKRKAWKPVHDKPLVCIHWLDADASAPTEAFYEEEITDRTTPVETYGLLVKETDDAVFIMNETYTEDDGKRVYRGKTRIPKSLVKEIEVLRSPFTSKERKPREKNSSSPPAPSNPGPS